MAQRSNLPDTIVRGVPAKRRPRGKEKEDRRLARERSRQIREEDVAAGLFSIRTRLCDIYTQAACESRTELIKSGPTIFGEKRTTNGGDAIRILPASKAAGLLSFERWKKQQVDDQLQAATGRASKLREKRNSAIKVVAEKSAAIKAATEKEKRRREEKVIVEIELPSRVSKRSKIFIGAEDIRYQCSNGLCLERSNQVGQQQCKECRSFFCEDCYSSNTDFGVCFRCVNEDGIGLGRTLVARIEDSIEQEKEEIEKLKSRVKQLAYEEGMRTLEPCRILNYNCEWCGETQLDAQCDCSTRYISTVVSI